MMIIVSRWVGYDLMVDYEAVFVDEHSDLERRFEEHRRSSGDSRVWHLVSFATH